MWKDCLKVTVGANTYLFQKICAMMLHHLSWMELLIQFLCCGKSPQPSPYTVTQAIVRVDQVHGVDPLIFPSQHMTCLQPMLTLDG
jgi:hypothetical protein